VGGDVGGIVGLGVSGGCGGSGGRIGRVDRARRGGGGSGGGERSFHEKFTLLWVYKIIGLSTYPHLSSGLLIPPKCCLTG